MAAATAQAAMMTDDSHRLALSVVIPTYDSASMTLRCCRAVLAALPEDAEVVVVDDGSGDGTAELLASEAPRVRVVRLESNHGFAVAANRGVAESRGAIVLLLNSDAIVEAAALRALLDAFESDAKLGVAGAQLVNEDGTMQWSGGRTPTLAWMIGVVSGAGRFARRFRAAGHATRKIDWVSGAAMAFRREVWRDAGPLRTDYVFYCQDIDFCLRAHRAGWRVAIVDAARVEHIIGGTIARDAALHHDPERLWPDLFTWGARHHGRVWALTAHPLLLAAAALRVLRLRNVKTFIRAMRRLAQSDS